MACTVILRLVRTLHISIKALFSSGTRGRGRPERENQLTKVYLEKVEVVVAAAVAAAAVVQVSSVQFVLCELGFSFYRATHVAAQNAMYFTVQKIRRNTSRQHIL